MTSRDLQTPWVKKSRAEIEASDLIPFRDAMAHGLPALMTSHSAAPELTNEGGLPMTLSSALLNGLLRSKLAFEGLVITDSLQMHGIAAQHDIGENAVEAFEAGADMLLAIGNSSDRYAAFEGLLRACRTGRITESRLRVSLRRILRLKALYRVSDAAPSHRPGAPAVDIAARIAARSVTILEDCSGMLAQLVQSIKNVIPADTVYVGPDGALPELLGVRSVILERHIDRDEMAEVVDEVMSTIGEPAVIIGAAQNRGQADTLQRIARLRPSARLILVSLGDPNDLEAIDRSDARLAAYSSTEAAQRAVAGVLRGERSAQGVLPVGGAPTSLLKEPRNVRADAMTETNVFCGR